MENDEQAVSKFFIHKRFSKLFRDVLVLLYAYILKQHLIHITYEHSMMFIYGQQASKSGFMVSRLQQAS